ncbi:BRLZ [Seminavis robusta]|uniref:BRLZ n=1 Tax=Seminavis robusta TaxID=568900 RepID=A0A9N8DRP1_9STRA|nr:BRLZ [Seminavis robusta]|eukprot:Sro322_g116950.1 BRLZ (485) ;mRNA; f:14579-16122
MTTLPALDISAALQAAVAAAAELARVGLSDDLAAAFASPAAAPATVSVPAQEQEIPTDTTPKRSEVVPVAPSPAPAAVVRAQPLQQQPQQQAIHAVEAESSNQCTGQDAAGDYEQQQHLRNDMSLSSGDDAAGERTFEESEEDAAKRLARSRERNREHARRTRLRKKAQLEALQSKVRELEAEKKGLKLKIEECSIASILINLAEPSAEEQQQQDDASSLLDATMQSKESQRVSDAKISLLTAGKRKRFASVDTSEENKAPQTLTLKIDGQTTIIGPRSSINWKSGVYSDENGSQRQLTTEQLEGLRRERNRMHAKMTRDRKKNFIATIEKTIEQLERDCEKMRDVLEKVGAQKQDHQQVLTAPVTPLMTPRQEEARKQPAPTVIAPAAQVPAIAATHSFLAPVHTPAPTPSFLVPVSAPAPTPVLMATTAPSPGLLVAAPAPTPSLLLPSLAAAVAYAQIPVAACTENPPKKARVAHGFSWNG